MHPPTHARARAHTHTPTLHRLKHIFYYVSFSICSWCSPSQDAVSHRMSWLLCLESPKSLLEKLLKKVIKVMHACIPYYQEWRNQPSQNLFCSVVQGDDNKIFVVQELVSSKRFVQEGVVRILKSNKSLLFILIVIQQVKTKTWNQGFCYKMRHWHWFCFEFRNMFVLVMISENLNRKYCQVSQLDEPLPVTLVLSLRR